MLDSPTSELLAIILLPVFIGFCWLVVVAFLRGPSATERSCGRSANRFALLSITDAFDPDHVILWQSQAPALRLIGPGTPLAELSEFFAHFSSLYPELFEGIIFDDWLRFLQNCDLVAREGRQVRLTSSGCSFLDYLDRTRKPSRPEHHVR